jgi:hypothetical protein
MLSRLENFYEDILETTKCATDKQNLFEKFSSSLVKLGYFES